VTAGSREIVRTVVRLVGRRGDRFALLEYADGGFGISRNDDTLQSVQFNAAQLEQCIEKLIELAELDGRDDARV
jgi:hypothetical protein